MPSVFLFRLLPYAGATVSAELYTVPVTGIPVLVNPGGDSATEIQTGLFQVEVSEEVLPGLHTIIAYVSGTPVGESNVYSDGSEGPFMEGNQFSPFTQINTSSDLYTTRESIERKYGKENVRIWSDRDGDNNPAKIDAVIINCIYDVSREIDSCVSAGTYQTPFQVPIPPIIEQIAAYRAGCALYLSRGIYSEFQNIIMNSNRKYTQALLDDVRRGRVQLNGGQVKKVFNNSPIMR